MPRSKTSLFSIAFSALVASVIMVTSSYTAVAQNEVAVPDEYRASCQSCHGTSGQGDGPVAPSLKVKPSDLTTLSKRNDGKFPFLKVFQTIDGRAIVPAHGTRDMPIWGQRYSQDIGEKYGPYGGETAIRARLLELVYYIQSIQR
jgi:mono/diheme cytochrome c family protein